MRNAGFVAVFVFSLSIAAYAIVSYAFLPLGAAVHPDMRSSFVAHRVGVYTHVFSAFTALALGPFQFVDRLRGRRPALHRLLGRLYLGVGVLVGGMAGLYLATRAFGGLVSRFGFAGLALAWLYTGLRAYRAIRCGEVAAHRRWMKRNFALSFAAVTLRLWIPASVVAGIPFATAYPVIAWLCWVPNLLAAEWWLRRAGWRTAPA